MVLCAGACALALGASVLAASQRRPIDTVHSRLTIHVGKEGLFSALGHDHEISAPVARGEVATTAPEFVEFTVETAKMIVQDPQESESSRADVQKAMLGAQVLDIAKYPEIHFVSESVERKDDTHWRVHGKLALHGTTKQILVETRLENGHYRGKVSLKQTDYGITPIRVAGGTVNVKDELEIDFDIMLAGQ
ncbi:MAG: YceI family protein [Candidatus Acidiferrales bacterium]